MEISNKAVGRNLAKFRMLRDMKAADLAERIGLKEDAYLKYERGETKITVDFIQRVATALNVDPITILSASPDNFIESISNNTVSSGGFVMGNGNEANLDVKGDFISVDKQQQETMMELMKSYNELTKKMLELLEKIQR